MADSNNDNLVGATPDELEIYRMDLLRALVQATKMSQQLPSGSDFNFHATSSEFRERMLGLSSRLSNVMLRLMQRVDPGISWDEGGTLIEDDEKEESLTDISDLLLERVDLSLDEAKSAPTPAAIKTSVVQAVMVKSPRATGGGFVNFMHARNVKRPQLEFPDKIDNALTAVFVPMLKEKPNALVPLDLKPYSLQKPQEVSEAISKHMNSLGLPQDRIPEGPAESCAHPYQHELDVYEPVDSQLTSVDVIKPSLQDTDTCVWVDDVDGLKALSTKLDAATEIAVDLEAHSYRAYDSFCCLMQISTRTEDFLVDTLALRGEMSILNSSFTNPKIVKVLHGADRDILWLQKDCGLYLVNMFDTGQATRVLEYPRFSLAYLLQTHCDITADKQYQLADWRIRPLTEEMAKYAQEDTHNLLYIYDILRNQLVAKGNAQANLIRTVWMRSRELCLLKYEKPLYNPKSADKLLEKFNRALSARQYAVLLALHAWRDKTAREEDESISYVLPDHMLFQLSDACPTKIQLVIACCQRGRNAAGIPPLVRLNSHVIVEVIRSAMAAASSNPSYMIPVSPVVSVKKAEHSTATEHFSIDLEPRKAVVADIKLLRGLLAEASDFAQSLSQSDSVSTSTKYEDVVKAEDVRSSFAHQSLFGPALDIAALEAMEAVINLSTANKTPEQPTYETPKRKATHTGDDVMVLSKMARTHVQSNRKRGKR